MFKTVHSERCCQYFKALFRESKIYTITCVRDSGYHLDNMQIIVLSITYMFSRLAMLFIQTKNVPPSKLIGT